MPDPTQIIRYGTPAAGCVEPYKPATTPEEMAAKIVRSLERTPGTLEGRDPYCPGFGLCPGWIDLTMEWTRTVTMQVTGEALISAAVELLLDTDEYWVSGYDRKRFIKLEKIGGE